MSRKRRNKARRFRVGEGRAVRGPHEYDQALHEARGCIIVAFQLDEAGRIGPYARLVHSSAGVLAEIAVPLLPRIAHICEPAGFATMMQAVNTYHAEQAGMAGRA